MLDDRQRSIKRTADASAIGSSSSAQAALVPIDNLVEFSKRVKMEKTHYGDTLQQLKNVEGQLQHAEQRNSVLERYCSQGIAYVQQLQSSSDGMANRLAELAELLRKEREAREIERSGYQQTARLSREQAAHFLEHCRGYDIRIEQFEREAFLTGQQYQSDMNEARKYVSSMADELSRLRDEIIKREQLVIARDEVVGTFDVTRREFLGKENAWLSRESELG